MKNIHILPTDQPSRLAIQLDCKPKYNLQLSKIESDWTHNWEKQHIYITSSEEIKEGDWFIHYSHNTTSLHQAKSVVPESIITINDEGCWMINSKKIILTDNSKIIADGVQSIDDNFLKWFVKNSSCDFVEVEEIGPGFPAGIYWINYLPEHFEKSIPQEEPKQYPMGSFAPGNYWHKECVTCKKEFIGDKRAVQCEPCAIKMTQEEPKQEKEEEYFKHLEKDKKEFAKEWEEIRQEFGFGKKDTLEEAAEKYSEDSGDEKSFIAGGKHMAERMYSDSIQFGTWLLSQDITSRGKGVYVDDKGNLLTVKDLFEQFKK